MTPEQRKAYNQRRYTPKNRKSGESSNNNSSIKQENESFTEEGLDALTSIEQVGISKFLSLLTLFRKSTAKPDKPRKFSNNSEELRRPQLR
jgi:hypothetical protein